jgi:hypothetical protein
MRKYKQQNFINLGSTAAIPFVKKRNVCTPTFLVLIHQNTYVTHVRPGVPKPWVATQRWVMRAFVGSRRENQNIKK